MSVHHNPLACPPAVSVPTTAPNIEQFVAGGGSSANVTFFFDTPTTAGNTLVLVNCAATTRRISGVSGGDSWEFAVQNTDPVTPFYGTDIWLAEDIGGGLLSYIASRSGSGGAWMSLIELTPCVLSNVDSWEQDGSNTTVIHRGAGITESGAATYIAGTRLNSPANWVDASGADRDVRIDDLTGISNNTNIHGRQWNSAQVGERVTAGLTSGREHFSAMISLVAS